jgi:hypothetical protein
LVRLRRIAAFVALAVVCAGAAAAGLHADEIELVTTALPTLHPGQAAWVSTLWRGHVPGRRHFKLTVDAPRGVSVSYPARQQRKREWERQEGEAQA